MIKIKVKYIYVVIYAVSVLGCYKKSDQNKLLFEMTLKAGYDYQSWLYFIPPNPTEFKQGSDWSYRGRPLVFSNTVYNGIDLKSHIPILVSIIGVI